MEPKENQPKKPYDWTYATGYAAVVFGIILVLGLSIERCRGR